MLKNLMHSATDFLGNLLSSSGNGDLGFLQILTAAGFAYLGGVLASLTPCVYPMIPITIGVIGGMKNGNGERRAWHEILFRAASYIFGMAVVYSFLGVLAGITGKVFGSFTNTSGWYLSLALIMNYAALIMLDVLPFDPASWWQSLKWKLGMKSSGPKTVSFEREEMTLLGAFLLGASSGFIAAPCTTPVLSSILAYIAKTQSIGLGMVLMFSFALGLGTLLLVVGIFTGALRTLPRSGGWMKRVKILSGLIMLGFAEYLIYRAGGLGRF
jgi:cytochrome c-type biogenesis protein